MKPAPRVELRRRGAVAHLVLRLARARIDERAAQELCAAAEELRLDDAIAVVVVESAGADFGLGFAGLPWGARLDCVESVARLPQPVVALVAGRAWAESCELALACDLRLASSAASFRLPQIAERRLPAHGASQRLPRLVGAARALEILWSGRAVGGAEAARIGLASRVLAPSRLARAAAALADELASKGAIALRLAKEAVRAASDLTLEQGMRLEQDLYVLLQTAPERAERVRAFQQRRPG